jgi:hypothetical protein
MADSRDSTTEQGKAQRELFISDGMPDAGGRVPPLVGACYDLLTEQKDGCEFSRSYWLNLNLILPPVW